jgi:hypothetical protein
LKPETSVKSTLGFFGPQQQKPSSDLQSIDGRPNVATKRDA